MASEPVVVSIAGSDSGGGAGIQADLRAFYDHRCFGTTAITAVTAQNTTGVWRVDPLSVEAVRAQIDAIREDMEPSAIKIGMLGTASMVEAVADGLAAWPACPPVVLDPVMVATSGDRLLDEDAIEAMRERLVPLSTLITPNLPEAAILARASGDPEALSEALLRWAPAVLVTGGDAETPQVVDSYSRRAGPGRVWRQVRVDGGPFHGTGCTLSSAIAAQLARQLTVEAAIGQAIAYVRRRLEAAWAPGVGSKVLGRG